MAELLWSEELGYYRRHNDGRIEKFEFDNDGRPVWVEVK